MKQGKSLMDLAQEIERQAATKRDYILPSRSLRLDTDRERAGVSALRFGDHDPVVTDITHNHIAGLVGIPRDYYRRMRDGHAELLDRNVNHWFERRDPGEERMVRTLDGNARALLSNSYKRRDNIDLLQMVLPELAAHPGLKVCSCEVTERKLYLKVASERLTRDVRVGEAVQVGMIVENSEIGEANTLVAPFSKNLICQNGMTHMEFGHKKRHVGRRISGDDETFEIYSDEALEADDRAYWLKVRDTVRYVLTDAMLDRVVNKMLAAAGIRIEVKLEDAVRELTNRYSLTEVEHEGVLTRLINGSDLSLWGLANAVTSLAAEVPSYDRASELEALGGRLTALPSDEPECLRGLVLEPLPSRR